MSQSTTSAPAAPAADAFSPLAKERSSARIADVIRRTIVEGRFRPGEQLPPERTLAERFQVTRNTVREALRNLEHLRLVTVRHGSGATVQDYLATAGIELLTARLVPEEGASRELLEDLLEARLVVGRAMCRHAVERARRDAVPALAEAVEAFVAEAEKQQPTPAALQALDFEVQNRLVRAGGNQVFILLHNSLRHVYERLARFFEPVVAQPAAMVQAYRALLKALKTQDRAAARRAVDAVYDAGAARRRRT